MKPSVRPPITTNTPRATYNDFYDTPEGHDQPMGFMRNSTGNNAVGAAGGGEFQPGRAIGGATLSALGGEASRGDGQPPNDGARQDQVQDTHASAHASSGREITEADVEDVLIDLWGETGNRTPAASATPAAGPDAATNKGEDVDNLKAYVLNLCQEFQRRESEHEKMMRDMRNRLGNMESHHQTLIDENG